MQRKLERKRVFVRLVSHEIRTPLNIVTMGLKLLEKDLQKADLVDKSSLARLLETVRDSEMSCTAAVEILDDMLAYEKLDAGLMLLDKTTLPAWDFIRDTVHPFNVQVHDYILHVCVCHALHADV